MGSPEEQDKNQRAAAHDDAREWMGIEPTRDRVNDPSTALKAAGTPIQRAQSQTLSVIDLGGATTSATKDDPELTLVAHNWAILPEPIKAGIVAIVRLSIAQTVAGTDGATVNSPRSLEDMPQREVDQDAP